MLLTLKNRLNLNSKNIVTLLLAAFFLIAPLFLTHQTVLAGDPNCQSGYISNPYNNNPAPRRPTQTEGQFAAAQIRNERSQPPRTGLRGGDSAMRSRFSFALSILILLGGIWALLVLLRQRFGKNLEQKRARLPKLLGFTFRPSFALSVFGLLFLSAIVGSVLTAPVAVVAEKREKPNKSQMTGLMNPSSKPVFKTAQQIGGDGITQIGSPVFDSAGNRYVRGGFTETLTIGATTLTASRYFDLFVAKYDANGTAIWARQGSGATANVPAALAVEGATALAVDASGNVYLGGSFVKTITLQGSGGANPNITLNDNGVAGVNYESFVAKYDQNGNLLWAKGGNSNSPKNLDNLETGQNGVDQIVFDASGNPYVTGFVSGNSFLGSPFANQGQSDILLAKLNPTNGAVIWKQIIGGTDDDNGLDLKIDGANNLFLIGNYGSPSITFPTVPATTFTNPDDPNDMLENSTNTFISKFDASGNNLWVKNLDNTDAVGGSQIAVNAAGEIFLTGYFFDSATFGATTLTESEGSGEGEESLGGYVTKMDASGNFVWAEEFGGLGEGVALDGAGRIYIVGTFYDGGTFGADTANVETLASFGGEDLFVARYDSDGGFDWAKPIAGSGSEGEIAVGNPSDPNGTTEDDYNPLGIAYNPASNSMFVSSDFRGVVTLDCLTLQTSGTSRQSYIAELSQDNEAVSCRIWNGLDVDDNNWESTDNWNGGIVPSSGNSVYVPYTGNSNDNPIYNPVTNTTLENLTADDDRTLSLNKNLQLDGALWLTGGFVNAGAANRLVLTGGASANRIADLDGAGGYVLGKLEKQFAAPSSFTFIVGTANGYSPVDVAAQTATSGDSLTVSAVEQAHPKTASAANHLNRFWTLTKTGASLSANLTFHYLQTDVAGDESTFKLFKIENNVATQQPATIDTTANTAAISNVSQFSDWTLSAPLAPTAASVTAGGRVKTADGRGVAQARVTMTDAEGNIRVVSTNTFGFYRFTNVAAGATYVFSVRDKRFRFSQSTQIQSIIDDRADINFTAAP